MIVLCYNIDMEIIDKIINQTECLISIKDTKNYNSLVFAYIGDAVFSLVIRTYFAMQSNSKAGVLNAKVNSVVCAKSQAIMYDKIEEILDDEEVRICKSARNIHTNNVAKNSNLEEYKKATSFEALIGYLYLIGNKTRLGEIIKKSLCFLEDSVK